MDNIKKNVRFIIILLMAIVLLFSIRMLSNLNNDLSSLRQRIEFTREQSFNQHNQIQSKINRTFEAISKELEIE